MENKHEYPETLLKAAKKRDEKCSVSGRHPERGPLAQAVGIRAVWEGRGWRGTEAPRLAQRAGNLPGGVATPHTGDGLRGRTTAAA